MRIVLVTHYFPAHRGGIELVAGALARRMASPQGAEITWHASDTDERPSIPSVRCVPASACNVIERRFGVPYPLWSPHALGELASAVRSADVLHLHDCLYLPNLVAFATARFYKRPIVVTQHIGLVPYRNPVLRGLLWIAYRAFAQLVLGGATQVVFVSETVRQYFLTFVKFRSPPLLIANGVDTAIFRPANAGERERTRYRLGVGPEQPLLLFVGRFVEKKGLPIVRELAKRMPETHWVLAGWGAERPEEWKLPNVTVMRGLSSVHLAPLYQAADLLVLPSRGEGFPLVVQEAMACGTPAMVGRETAAGCPGAADLLISETVTTCSAADLWERRLLELISPAGQLPTLRPRVAEYARRNWTWDACAERYRDLMERCMGAHASC